jgi:hypothetical protein
MVERNKISIKWKFKEEIAEKLIKIINFKILSLIWNSEKFRNEH